MRLGCRRLLTAQTGFNSRLKRRAELAAIGTEHLDAVVLRWVMAGGHHQATSCPKPANQTRDCRGWTEPKGPDLPPGCGEAGRKRGHEHGSARAGIHPDQHRPISGKHPSTPKPHLQSQRGGDRRTDMTTQAIGAKTHLGRIRTIQGMECR